MASARNSAFWPTQFLDVAKLDLDVKNPRLGGTGGSLSPREIVQYLFEHDKAREIAESIATRGYFPNEPVLAIKSGKRYVVIEGNRRLAALMALRDPSLLSEGSDQRAVDRLKKRIAKDAIDRIPVTIAPNRRLTDQQVAGRHVGTPVLAWKAENRARFILEKLEEGYTDEELLTDLGFSATDVRSARETRAILTLARGIDLPAEVKEKIDNLRTKSLSALERLFESTVGREIMRVERDPEHGYRVMTTKAEFIPFFQELVTRVTKKQITTRTLNDAEKIRRYFKEEWAPSKLPAKRNASFVPTELRGKPVVKRKSAAVPTPARQKPVLTKVLPKTLHVVYGADRLKIIRDELVEIDRNKKANAGAVLLRVFFELCLVDYLIRSGRMATLISDLRSKGIKWRHDYPQMKYLVQELITVAKNNLSKPEALKVEKALTGGRSMAHVLTDLHAFVHDFAELPTGADILQFWLRTEPIFRLMLETDPADHK